ncbi:MAG: GDSL-type esterase/lipase family protein [Polyangiaceae bacterium]
MSKGRSSLRLALSLALNAVLLALAAGYLARRFLLAPPEVGEIRYTAERLSILSELPARKGGTVFLGDSLTERGEWAELFGDASLRNRGVAGDTTTGVLARVDLVTSLAPERVFLLVGVNDLGAGEPVPAIAERYAAIVSALAKGAPAAKLYCESVFPVREGAPRLIDNDKIRALNAAIAKIAAERGCTYVDVQRALVDGAGELDASFTVDGLHLNGKGYAVWASALAPLLRPAD